MQPDPKLRKDRKCAIASCRKKLPALAVKDGDPFCSTECCREFHGVVYANDARATGNRRKTQPTAAQIPRVSGHRTLGPRTEGRAVLK